MVNFGDYAKLFTMQHFQKMKRPRKIENCVIKLKNLRKNVKILKKKLAWMKNLLILKKWKSMMKLKNYGSH